MRDTKIKIRIFISSILFMMAISLFAVEPYVSDVYSSIDNAFTNNDKNNLDRILSGYQNDKNYYLMENYTLKKIRRLIIDKEYDFAMDSILIVIENNIDNESAVEMYSSISDAYDLQKKYEENQAMLKKREEERLAIIKESERPAVEKEYEKISTEKGKTVYTTKVDKRELSYSWDGALGLVDLGYITSADGGISLLNYGISLDFNYVYDFDYVSFGIDGSAAIKFLKFMDTGSNLSLLADLQLIPKLSIRKFSKNFFLRMGVAGFITGKTDNISSLPESQWKTYQILKKTNGDNSIQGTFITPAVGVQIADLSLGIMKFDLAVDYYPGHLYTNNLNFAAGAEANLTIEFAKLDEIRLFFNIGLKDKFLLKDTGIENRADFVLAIGVGNVNK
jgi:6-pyruvoyl-tetrahydropterin synthase